MAMSNTELQKKTDSNEQKAEALRAKILQNSQEITDVEDDFREMQKISQDLAAQFKEVQFSKKVAATQQYDENTNFTENNIGMYLSELEEYISGLITYVSSK